MNESPDEDDSQATDSVMGDPDISLGYSDFDNTVGKENASFGTLPITLSMLEANKDEESDGGDFVPVRNTRRPFFSTEKPSEITPDVQKQFGERVSGLDWIGTPCGKLGSSDHDSNRNPNSKSFEDFSRARARQSLLSSTATILDTQHPAAKIKTSQVTSTTSKVPQLQEISPRVAPEMQTNESQSKAEVPNTLRHVEISSLGGESVQMPDHTSMRVSGDASVSTSHRVHSELPTREHRPEESSKVSSQITPGQISSYAGNAWSKSLGQSERSPTPITFSQNLQTNTMARKPTTDPPPGFNVVKKIPEGVFVVCDHFLQNNRRQPARVCEAIKTCKICENQGRLKYATWNNSRYYWQIMRTYPMNRIPPKVVLDVCRHFSTDRPCPKEPCTFPHGKQETIMWTLEREGRKYMTST